MFIIRFFFVAFFLLLLLGVLGVLLFFHSIGNIKRQFDRMNRNCQYQSDDDNAGWQSDSHSQNNQNQQTIRDNRPLSEREKRIFKEGEGEYVDFVETE